MLAILFLVSFLANAAHVEKITSELTRTKRQFPPCCNSLCLCRVADTPGDCSCSFGTLKQRLVHQRSQVSCGLNCMQDCPLPGLQNRRCQPPYPQPSYHKPSYPQPSYPRPSYPQPSYPQPYNNQHNFGTLGNTGGYGLSRRTWNQGSCTNRCMPSCQPNCIRAYQNRMTLQQPAFCIKFCTPDCATKCVQEPSTVYPSPAIPTQPMYPSTDFTISPETRVQAPIPVAEPTAVPVCPAPCMPACTDECIRSLPPTVQPNQIQIDLPESIKQQPNCDATCRATCTDQCLARNYRFEECSTACKLVCASTCASAPAPILEQESDQLVYTKGEAKFPVFEPSNIRYTAAASAPEPASSYSPYLSRTQCQSFDTHLCLCPNGYKICVSGIGAGNHCCRM